MIRVLVYVNELAATSIPVEIAARVHAMDSVEITLVSHYDDTTSQLDPEIKRLDVPQVHLGATSRTDLSAYRTLRRLCSERDIDVVHTHHNATGSMARLTLTGTGIPIVDTEHSSHDQFSPLQKLVNTSTYPLTDVIISNSEHTHRSHYWYENLLALNSIQTVIYNGVDIDRIDSANRSPIELPAAPIVVSLGRLIEVKNYEFLLRCFRRVVERVPEANLVVVGDGPLLTQLKQFAADLGIDESVVFTGYISHRESVYTILKQSDIATFPSLSEGFCVAAVEAMAAGLPVVVSDIDVLHEVVGKPGLFANPNKPAEFMGAIIELLEDPQKRNKLGVHAKQRARSKFSLERTAQEYYNIYKQVAKTPT